MTSRESALLRAALVGLLALFLPKSGVAREDAMNFRVIAAQNCRAPCPLEIVAEGAIAMESADAFRAVAVRFAPKPVVVRLSSSGGSLVGSLRLGQAFREFNAEVIVGKDARCVSACVYAFLGGNVRRVAGGRIGVHRFRPENEETDNDFPAVLVQRALDILTTYVTQMGADPELVSIAMGVSSREIRFFNGDELRRLRVIN
ncbi:MAG: hypothetical protein QOJ86_1332 [Bradyrhizobium sp.]|jgi:hypothetical protein|nr:hypothetical protein [Bradyrhizobium sp.]